MTGPAGGAGETGAATPNAGAFGAAAFSVRLAPHYGDVTRFCRALCAGWAAADAEDVLQQALLTALEHHAELRDPARFRPWLFRIVTRTYYAAARRRFWRRFVPLAVVAEREMPAVYGTADAADVADVLAALGRLAPADRAALLLFEVAGFSLEEVAAVQGDRTLSATKSRLSRARRRARALLAEPAGAPAPHDAASVAASEDRGPPAAERPGGAQAAGVRAAPARAASPGPPRRTSRVGGDPLGEGPLGEVAPGRVREPSEGRPGIEGATLRLLDAIDGTPRGTSR